MENWIDRRITPLPQTTCKIRILTNEGVEEGTWNPFNPKNYSTKDMPQEGYLGTVIVQKKWNNSLKLPVGFDAWGHSENEFILYQLI